MIRHISYDQDAAINMTIAAIKTSEQYQLRELPEQAPETTEEYVMNALTNKISKNQINNETWSLKDNLDSWQFVDWKWIAANTDLEVPEYERY